MKDIKPVVTEKNVFVKSNFSWGIKKFSTLWNIRISRNLSQPSTTSTNFSIQALMEEIKPEVTQKGEFNNRDESKKKHFSKFSDQKNSNAGKKPTVF